MSYRLPTPLQEQLRQNQSETWLVTGVAGFIGSHLLEALLSHGQKVVGVDSFITGHQSNLDDVRKRVGETSWANFEFHHEDIRTTQKITSICKGEGKLGPIKRILHQAALGSVPRSVADPLNSNEMNVTGFLSVLHSAHQAGEVKRVVYASSSSVYGDGTDATKVETRIGNPLSPYAATKRCDEIYAESFAHVYGQSLVGLRYFNVFGPRQDPDGPYAAVIPRWIKSLGLNERCQIFGDGETSRDFCYVANVVQANLLAALSPKELRHEIFNVAVGTTTSLNTLFAHLSREVGKVVKTSGGGLSQPEYHPFRPGDIKNSLADVSKAKQDLNYAPAFTLEEGLEITVPAFLETLSSNNEKV